MSTEQRKPGNALLAAIRYLPLFTVIYRFPVNVLQPSITVYPRTAAQDGG